MRFARLVRRYNQAALAIVLTWAVVAAAMITFYAWRDVQEFDDYSERETQKEETLLTGEEIETPEGTITVYQSEVPEDRDAVRDVRYVSMGTGKVTRIANDPSALIYQEKAVGKIGRVALIKTAARDERPVFDFVFVSFPELERFTIARAIYALDTTQQLDDNTFSAIVWDEPGLAHFIIVDARTGAIELARSLDFRISRKAVADAQLAADVAVIEAVIAVNDAAQSAR